MSQITAPEVELSQDTTSSFLGATDQAVNTAASRPSIGPRVASAPTLTIVIPALNEEESIGQTIQRCLDAQEHIQKTGGISRVEIIVISDGSTDQTSVIAQKIASREHSVSVIIFPTNRGYGAAIKEGFERGSGDFVAFLDADGTCDPVYFADMCQTLQDQSAMIVLGSRMGVGNHMPPIRRLGNRIYAVLLALLSGRAVSDTASGMRVIRREALADLYPLPDGLHFTPAMSARALMNDIRIAEIPMPYSERQGESKLHVLRDGIRFFRAIWDAMLLYRPSRLFMLAGTLCLVFGVLWILYPAEFYVQNRRLEEWMIYRILLSSFLFTCSFLLVGSGAIAERIISLVSHHPFKSFGSGVVEWFFAPSRLGLMAVLAGALALVLVGPGLLEYITTGQVSLHWSRVIIAICLLQIALFAVIAVILQQVISLWKGQLEHDCRSRLPSNPL